MSYAPTSPVTGLAQTGLTSPTYTISSDVAPEGQNAKQYVVTALGGTQSGVTVHSAASPFTINFVRQKVLKVLQAVSGQLTLVSRVPRNSHKLVTRKGVTILSGQPAQVMTITTTMDIPAGAETVDSANVRAALSAHFGVLSQQSSGIGDTAVNGVL